jgi:hypothetical protein
MDNYKAEDRQQPATNAWQTLIYVIYQALITKNNLFDYISQLIFLMLFDVNGLV